MESLQKLWDKNNHLEGNWGFLKLIFENLVFRNLGFRIQI